MIKGQIFKAMREAPAQLAEGLFDVIAAPPKRAVELMKKCGDHWENLPEEEKQLYRDAAVSLLHLTAKMIIAADKGAKKEF